MRLSGQFQACLFFFYKKVLSIKKHKQKSPNKTKLRKHKTKKATFFMGTKASKRTKVICFAHFGAFFFLHSKPFHKKISSLEIVLIASLYHTTDMYPINPPMANLPSFKNLFSSKIENDILLILYDPILCFCLEFSSFYV